VVDTTVIFDMAVIFYRQIYCCHLSNNNTFEHFLIAVGTRGTDCGRLVAMATAQPAFSMAAAASAAVATTETTASPSDLVGGGIGGGGSGGGGGGQQGQQAVSPTATVTVVTSQQQQSSQQIVSANSISITAVTHQALQQVRETIHQHRVAYSLGKSKSV
jgi:hypothetical protein